MMDVFLHLMAGEEYGTAAKLLIKPRVLGAWQGEYWVVLSNWNTTHRKQWDVMSVLLSNMTHLHVSLGMHHQLRVLLPLIMCPLVMIFFIAEPVVMRIPPGAGAVTILPTEQTTIHLVLQAVGLQAVSMIACQTIATIEEVAILETVRPQATLTIARQSIAALVEILPPIAAIHEVVIVMTILLSTQEGEITAVKTSHVMHIAHHVVERNAPKTIMGKE